MITFSVCHTITLVIISNKYLLSILNEFIILDASSNWVYIYIYIYIVIHRQSVSLDHNSWVWLDARDASSWDRKPSDFTLVSWISYRRAIIFSVKERILCIYIFLFSFFFTYTLNSCWSAQFIKRALYKFVKFITNTRLAGWFSCMSHWVI